MIEDASLAHKPNTIDLAHTFKFNPPSNLSQFFFLPYPISLFFSGPRSFFLFVIFITPPPFFFFYFLVSLFIHFNQIRSRP